MPHRKTTVTLTGPARIDGQDMKKGDQVEVTIGVALQLVELGALAALPEVELPGPASDEDQALHEKALAMAETMVGQKVAEALAETAAELANERRRADDLGLKLAEAQAERDSLRAQLAVATAPKADKDTAEHAGGEVSDTAPKKRGK
ncbi:hypothetical protein [Paracoccus sanguinis]|uniref:DUF7210 domain-containing protein n=1 Tax=Paracoccus sanguinis TaxID=1545044 RepID=A0A1H2SSL9_9RHOB|nr:hypothetical protein [Paracoccus sanguinis]KGJ19313.1 hypothetical protein IX57_00165 [Paracoccus sanguinis]SDW34049.1 hypothetical protein SAMN05444276_101702 [Paracoccus sanguinis]